MTIEEQERAAHASGNTALAVALRDAVDLIDIVWTNIALDRSSTARDVACFVVPERLDIALQCVARYLAEQDQCDDTSTERIMRDVISEAILGYLS